jgi:hypothetical protein
VRLELPELVAADRPEPLHPVLRPTALELGEPGQLRLVERDHDLAAALVRDLVLVREALHLGLALSAEPGLQRPGPVVEPGVEHARVVPALVRRELRLLLHHREAQIGPPQEQLVCRGQADDPAPDHDDVEALAHPPHLGARAGASATGRRR